MAVGYTWEEIRTQLVRFAAYFPPDETLELCIFGGSAVLHWGMQDRLSNDVDVLQSLSSPGLLEVAAAAGAAVRFRNVDDPEPGEPYIEIAPPEADPYLPRFSVYEQVRIAPNLVLNVPAPAEIAASKMAFADRVIRVKDLQDIDFIRNKFGVTQDQILTKIFGIEIETHRRCAIMNWNQLDRLISEIPQRKAELEEHMSLVDELEQTRQAEKNPKNRKKRAGDARFKGECPSLQLSAFKNSALALAGEWLTNLPFHTAFAGTR
jgi:hypothetical protein